MKKTFRVKGMFCPNCEKRIRNAVIKLAGIRNVEADYQKQELRLDYDEELFDYNRFKSTVESLGYELSGNNPLQLVSILLIIISSYVILKHLNLLQVFNIFPTIETSFSLGTLFVTGMLTSVHCVAMCGGIILSQSILSQKKKGSFFNEQLKYNSGRLLSYTLIGLFVGVLGKLLSFNGASKGIIAIIAGIAMMIMSFNMLGIFNVFRKIRFPFIEKLYSRLRGLLNSSSSFLIGLLNGLMPCGPLQSMQLYALSSGSALKGALSMFVFGLGTLPLLYGFGFLSQKLNRKSTGKLLTASAFLIFLMGFNMFSNGMSLSGVSVEVPLAKQGNKKAVIIDDVQRIQTQVDYGSYESFTVTSNIPVEWIIYVPQGKLNGCNGEILVPEYDLDIRLQEGENMVRFTPDKTGEVPYSCWMGMIRSTIRVVD